MSENRNSPVPRRRTDHNPGQASPFIPPANAGQAYPSSAYSPEGFRPSGAQAGAFRSYTTEDAHKSTVRYVEKNDKKKKKKRGILWRIVFWISLLVFIGSLAALGFIVYGYYSQNKAYEEVAQAVFTPPTATEEGEEYFSLADFQVDWNALKAQNHETVAWIYIPGTMVNYPIVHASSNEKYLTTDFFGYKSYPSTGAIFLAAENAPDFSDTNSILYGHHMLDGSMFSTIDKLRGSSEEFNAHRTIYILTPHGNFRLTSFAVIVASGTETLAQPNFSTPTELQTYIQNKLDRNEVIPDPYLAGVLNMDKIFTLSTCSYVINDGRAVLYAAVVESTVNAGDETPDLTELNPEDAAAVEDAAKEL